MMEGEVQITEMPGTLGGIQSMAGELGVSEAQAKSGAEALLPAILGGFKKQAQAQPGGLDGLLGMVGGLGGGGLASMLDLDGDGNRSTTSWVRRDD